MYETYTHILTISHRYSKPEFPYTINAFSSSVLTYQGVPIGDAYNEVRPLLIKNAYAMSCLGDESNYCFSTGSAETEEGVYRSLNVQ